MATTTDGWSDFHDIDERGVITVIAMHWNTTPELLMPYVVGDGEGNTCFGVVVEKNARLARVHLHLDTFRNFDE